jgi:hypothetical protein
MGHWATYEIANVQNVADLIVTDDLNLVLDCMSMARTSIGIDTVHAFSDHKAVGKTQIWLLVAQRLMDADEGQLASVAKTEFGYALSGFDRGERVAAGRKTSALCRKLLKDAVDRMDS